MEAIQFILLLCCFPCLAHGQAGSAADVCKKIEYAELKDMPKDELYGTFCQYTALTDIEFHAFEGLVKAAGETPSTTPALRAAIQSTLKDAETHRIQGAQCGQEADRIFGILNRVYKVSERPKKADCDAFYAAKKASEEKIKK